MKKAGTIVLFLLFVAAFLAVQNSVVKYRQNQRVEEKILLVTGNPKVAKITALGFDNLLADLDWIRAIQFFGGNFTTLHNPKKRDGFMLLLNTLVTLDERFVSAWKFGGFAINESVKDATAAVEFLARGAEINPNAWELSFDAGFISYYQLGNTSEAKKYFERAYSPSRFRNGRLASLQFSAVSDQKGTIALIPNPEPGPLGEISGLVGIIPHQLATAAPVEESTATVIYGVLQQSGSDATFDIHVANNSQNVASFDLRVQYDPSSYKYRSAVASEELRNGTFTVEPVGEGLLAVRGDYIDPRCPSYVPRMAIEMDYAAGQFLSAWEQYVRYYNSAILRGDEISATIASDKLDTIYSKRCKEILLRAVEAYYAEKGVYPSTRMRELLDSGILMQTVQKILEEDPRQADVLRVLTYPNGIEQLLWERPKPDVQLEPHILVLREEGGQTVPVIENRLDLLKEQKSLMEGLQYAVKAFEREYGRPPSSLDELMEKIPQLKRTYPNGMPQDPLGGEFYVDSEGKVQVRNMKY
jgi:tetratricopeptide (TPR) repeat protein